MVFFSLPVPYRNRERLKYGKTVRDLVLLTADVRFFLEAAAAASETVKISPEVEIRIGEGDFSKSANETWRMSLYVGRVTHEYKSIWTYKGVGVYVMEIDVFLRDGIEFVSKYTGLITEIALVTFMRWRPTDKKVNTHFILWQFLPYTGSPLNNITSSCGQNIPIFTDLSLGIILHS